MMTLHSPIRHTDPARQFPLVKNGESRYNECGAEILLCGRSHLLHRGVGRFQLSTSRPLFALSLLYCIYGQFASSFFHGPDIPGRFSFCSASFLLRRRLVRRPSPRGVLLAAEEHLSRGGQVLRRPQRRLRRRLSGPSPDRACPAMAAAKKRTVSHGEGGSFLAALQEVSSTYKRYHLLRGGCIGMAGRLPEHRFYLYSTGSSGVGFMMGKIF